MKLLNFISSILLGLFLTFSEAITKPNKNNPRKSQQFSLNSKNVNAQQQKLLLEVRAKAIQELTKQIKELTDELGKNIDYFEPLAHNARIETGRKIASINEYFNRNGAYGSGSRINAVAQVESELKIYLENRSAYNAQIRLQRQLQLLELNKILKSV